MHLRYKWRSQDITVLQMPNVEFTSCEPCCLYMTLDLDATKISETI